MGASARAGVCTYIYVRVWIGELERSNQCWQGKYPEETVSSVLSPKLLISPHGHTAERRNKRRKGGEKRRRWNEGMKKKE